MKEIIHLKTVDSTNEEAKRRVCDGLAVVADEQTGGKGRQGRSFLSAAGKGLYVSCVMRVNCDISHVAEITARAAVCVHSAIESTCGIKADIKWPNDLVFASKKLCGILTELYFDNDVPYVILGIGINLNHDEHDFGGLSDIAVSIKQICGKEPDKELLFRNLICEIDKLFETFPEGKAHYLQEYRRFCVTTGKNVSVIKGTEKTPAFAECVNDDFALVVRYEDGSVAAVDSGEVSIR